MPAKPQPCPKRGCPELLRAAYRKPKGERGCFSVNGWRWCDKHGMVQVPKVKP